jgi:hypothetical protein
MEQLKAVQRSPALNLRRWATWGATLRLRMPHPITAPTRAICAFEGLISRGRAVRKLESDELREVLRWSHRRLRPLGEPLDQQFGLDRWLADAREEDYSDRLQWLLGQMTVGELTNVLGLFPVFHELGLDQPHDKMVGEREVWIDYGNQGGRIDILVRLSAAALLVIEVKKGDAGHAAIQQLLGYKAQLARKLEFIGMRAIYVLLSAAAESPGSHGIKVRDYARFSRNLRRLSITWMGEKPLQAAATLMLAGAIEANLLGLSSQKGSMNDHLRRFADSEQYEVWEH